MMSVVFDTLQNPFFHISYCSRAYVRMIYWEISPFVSKLKKSIFWASTEWLIFESPILMHPVSIVFIFNERKSRSPRRST